MLTCGWSAVTIIDGDRVTVKPFCCRSWGCEACAEARLRQLRAMGIAGTPTTFITLTSRVTKDSTPDWAAMELVKAWRLVRRRLIEQGISKKVEFLAVFEETKKGWPHLHIIARCAYIEQKLLSKWMGELTNSPIVDIRKVRSVAQAVNYVTKYIAKAPKRFAGCKRYWRSKGWAPNWVNAAKRKKLSTTTATLHQFSVNFVAQRFIQAGWQAEKIDATGITYSRCGSPYIPLVKLEKHFPHLKPLRPDQEYNFQTAHDMPHDEAGDTTP